jgi:hypothetical protein
MIISICAIATLGKRLVVILEEYVTICPRGYWTFQSVAREFSVDTG